MSLGVEISDFPLFDSVVSEDASIRGPSSLLEDRLRVTHTKTGSRPACCKGLLADCPIERPK